MLQLRVGARSALGALVLHSGGLVVDHGRVRVLAGAPSGAAGLPGPARVNRFPAAFDPAWRPLGALVVAHDVLGRVFALNGHEAACGRPGAPGQMLCFAPDSLEREAREMGCGTWLTWLLPGRLDQFHDGLRWPGRQRESQSPALSQGIAGYPFLRSKEARADSAATTRTPVPLTELPTLSSDFCRQTGLGDPGFLGSFPSEGPA
ncbi:DUF2625 family protein [Streptomyces sp. NPDC005773]|uniref:DUF2625 family protein n=1 Tax=Streptomyces sp. NPDC005773 TaxID=3364727 RepID=UPI0036AC21D7